MPNSGRRLTLKDRLSRLTHCQACRLLGTGAEQLIRRGGAYEVDLGGDVYLGDDLFRLRLNGAVVTVTSMAGADQHLRWNCTRCQTACEHVGAALSLILEEKIALGLAAPPPERVPVENLNEEELVQRAIAERKERARTQRMTVRSTKPKTLWTDYLVTNAEAGKTYRVALRGWEPGDSYCSCPDFRKNTLGFCKHIFAVQSRVTRRFPASVRRRRYRHQNIAVHVKYGTELELRLLLPARLEVSVERIVRSLRDQPIHDVRRLVRVLAKLEKLGQTVTIYPDAEEYIHRELFRKRIEATVAQKAPHGEGQTAPARLHGAGWRGSDEADGDFTRRRRDRSSRRLACSSARRGAMTGRSVMQATRNHRCRGYHKRLAGIGRPGSEPRPGQSRVSCR
jgi:hypothetical protein